MKEMITGKYGGIGAAIRYYKAKDRIAIVEPTEGMPAAAVPAAVGSATVLIGFGGLTEEEIRDGLERLAAAWLSEK